MLAEHFPPNILYKKIENTYFVSLIVLFVFLLYFLIYLFSNRHNIYLIYIC